MIFGQYKFRYTVGFIGLKCKSALQARHILYQKLNVCEVANVIRNVFKDGMITLFAIFMFCWLTDYKFEYNVTNGLFYTYTKHFIQQIGKFCKATVFLAQAKLKVPVSLEYKSI